MLVRGKVLAYDVISDRAARSVRGAPLIISIPKLMVDAMKVKKGHRLRVYTDGEKIYLDRFKEPEI
jgi:hypothetical protein